MYTRVATVPDHSFFLFGPRGTGKTTWLREHLGEALWFNLLLEDDYLPLLASARSFRERVGSAFLRFLDRRRRSPAPARASERGP
jgi:hypothetical protein